MQTQLDNARYKEEQKKTRKRDKIDSVVALLTLFCGQANRCIRPGALEEDHNDIDLHMG